MIYSSDQGFFLGDHGWFDKRFMYEEAYRAAALGPLARRHQSRHHAPTRSSRTSTSPRRFWKSPACPCPHDMQGQSLVPLLGGPNAGGLAEEFVLRILRLSRRPHGQQARRRSHGRYKLLHFYELGEWELYDLQKDPHEMHSVFAEPDYAAVAHDMQNELARLREVYQVPPFPLLNHRALARELNPVDERRDAVCHC